MRLFQTNDRPDDLRKFWGDRDHGYHLTPLECLEEDEGVGGAAASLPSSEATALRASSHRIDAQDGLDNRPDPEPDRSVGSLPPGAQGAPLMLPAPIPCDWCYGTGRNVSAGPGGTSSLPCRKCEGTGEMPS